MENSIFVNLVLGQHLDGPDAPHEGIQHLAVYDLPNEASCLLFTEVLSALVLSFNLFWHVFIIVAFQIVASHLRDL